MNHGVVAALFIAPNEGEPMKGVYSVNAIEQKGLEGDRYAGDKGVWSKSRRKVIRHVTLIELEAIGDSLRKSGVVFMAPLTRRNIVVWNFPLNGLIGREFKVGQVRMRGIELCEPCNRPSILSGIPGFETLFSGRGGLRAEVLNSERIRVGDHIRLA